MASAVMTAILADSLHQEEQRNHVDHYSSSPSSLSIPAHTILPSLTGDDTLLLERDILRQFTHHITDLSPFIERHIIEEHDIITSLVRFALNEMPPPTTESSQA